jgi:uncharacterized protein (DUF1015 family)
VIGATTLDELLSADPYNIVRLILPGRLSPALSPAEADVNEQAARRLHSWLDAGILAADPEPSLYVYEQRSAAAGGQQGGRPPGLMQRGLIALVKVGDPETSGIVPHEDVMPGPVRDRRDLMAATRSNLEPIFLVYEGRAGATTTLTDQVAEQEEPLATAVTPDCITHRLWRLADPARHAAIAADLATRSALIADGHHRYAAYRELRDQMRAHGHGAGPWDYGLAFLVDADAYPPRLGAIHRVIPALDLDRAAELAAKAFKVRPITPASLADALNCLASSGQDGPVFLLASQSRYCLVAEPDPTLLEAAMPATASARWRQLDAAVLQQVLLATAWGIQDNERDVLVFHDAAEAVSAAAMGGTAVIMNPVPFPAVRDIALHGERVPRKSTSFGPKPRSGLVLRTFHQEGGRGDGMAGSLGKNYSPVDGGTTETAASASSTVS